MDFNEAFMQYTAAYPETVREELLRIADRDALLSVQGITRVLAVLHEQETSQPEPTDLYRVDL